MNRLIIGLGPVFLATAAAFLFAFPPQAHSGDKPSEGSSDLLTELAELPAQDRL